jgi:hypothetical protein
MTFGQIKSLVEKNLIESYSNQKNFKKTIKEFKENILTDKSLSKLYSLYDQLSTPQGLSESEAKEFLNEGVLLIQETLKKTKLLNNRSKDFKNEYEDIDRLVYGENIDINGRILSKKNIISKLMSENKKSQNVVNLPIKTMVKIGQLKISEYINNLDEDTKKEFIQIISEDSKVLEEKYTILKEDTLSKLNSVMDSEKDLEIKNKISETIDRIKSEGFNQFNFVKLKNLGESL